MPTTVRQLALCLVFMHQVGPKDADGEAAYGRNPLPGVPRLDGRTRMPAVPAHLGLTRGSHHALTRQSPVGAHMLNRNADGGRTPLTGRVDFTMMSVAHDTFTRDLQRLTAGAGTGQTAGPVVRTG
jgi:hypothetical protein